MNRLIVELIAPFKRLPVFLILSSAITAGSVTSPLRAQDKNTIAAIPDRVEFNRDVRPILSDNCFYCHGPDKNHREAELRLDTAEGIMGDGNKKGVIDRANLEKSKLLRRITSTDVDKQMPPPDSGKKLGLRDLEVLTKWVAQGAEFEGHWAFLPVKTLAKLGVSDHSSGISTNIDKFIELKRSDSPVKANAEADRVTLLRRLSFDLTGLPPTYDEIRSFLNDNSAQSWEKQVDRLMASPHYGERMAMWWLDLVRYADSVGYHGDQEVSVSPFRQYVIESFNDNKPFDQFTIEQLGGDLMSSPTQVQKIAAGYNRLGMMSAEGGVQPKEYLAKYAAERVRNVSGTWLGVTLGCSECHDHKFDPFTTKEFYQMEAFFADIKEKGLYSGSDFGSSMKVPTIQQKVSLQSMDSKIAELTRRLTTDTTEIAASRERWLNSQPVWSVLKPVSLKSQNGAELKLLGDGSILATGKKPANDTFEIEVANYSANIAAIRLEVLPDDALPAKGPGRAGNGNFVLSEFVVYAINESGKSRRLDVVSAVASYEQTGAAKGNPYGKWAVAAAIDKDLKGAKWGWAVMEKAGTPQSAVFMLKPGDLAARSEAEKTVKLKIELQQNHDNPEHTLGRFRLSATLNDEARIDLKDLAPALEPILAKSADKRTRDENDKIIAHYRTIAPELASVRVDLQKIQQERSELEKQITSTLVTEQIPPRMIRVLPRGNWMDESGAEVQPGFPAVINKQEKIKPMPDRRLNRLDLATWLVDSENPLTSRVLANRLWKLFFGDAISRKVDDLGSQGQPPTHPELLDYLAGELVRSGWDTKKFIKALLMTKAYRQSSIATTLQLDLDPFNMLLARQGRFRLDAEMVRDNALSISGLLVRKIGGQSVRPYQPAGYWAYLNFPTREWRNDQGESLYRRGLYTHWQRQYLHPSLLAFDAPNREECTADRARSNTPLQSLVLLNDPIYIEAARNFAAMIIEKGGKDSAERIQFAFARALSRPARDEEVQILQELLASAEAEYRDHPEKAKELLSVGSADAPNESAPTQIAAWTQIARAILNLHETITRN